MRFRDRRATALSSIMAAQTASSMTVPGRVIHVRSCRGDVTVAVRVDLLKALSHYVKCIAKSFNISVRYKNPVEV